MKILLTQIGIFIFYLLQSCSSLSYINTKTVDINLSERIDSANIAVLPFSKQGLSLPAFTGTLFADKLSDELFLSKEYTIVDKSQIKEVFKLLEINKSGNLDYSEIKNIGSRLNAKYVLTGSILQYTNNQMISLESEYKFQVTCRILSIESDTIVGVISVLSESKNANVIDILDIIAKKIVKELRNDY